MKQRIICMLLSVAMIFTAVDIPVQATETRVHENEAIHLSESEVVGEQDVTTAEMEEVEIKIEEELGKDSISEKIDYHENSDTKALQQADEISTMGATSGKCGENLTWEITEDKLIISGTGPMYDYASGDDKPWGYLDVLEKELVLEEGITRIGDYAFYDCFFEGGLNIPSTVTSIGESSFDNCTYIEGDLIIPDTVTSMGKKAFQGTYFTGDLILGKGLTIIEEDTFCGGGFGGKLVIPDNITSIGDWAFFENSFEGDLIIPDSVTYIGDRAFTSCRFDGDLVISKNVKRIGKNAFASCFSEGKLTIPEGVEIIGDGAFGYSKFTGELKLPNSLKVLEQEAFHDCYGFTGELVIPEGVTKIGWRAFGSCWGLSGNLEIPDSVTEIDAAAFSGCVGMNGELKLSKAVSIISKGAFEYCNFTGDLTIPEGVVEIGEEAFKKCDGFTGTLKLPKSVTKIGDGAFEYCSGFTGDLVIPNGVAEIGEDAFFRCEGFDGELLLSNSLENIGKYAFCDGRFTGDLVIPDSVTEIGVAAFLGCEELTGELVLSKNLTQIAEGAFVRCGFSGDLEIPSSVKAIGKEAFTGCNNITSIYVPPSVVEIGKWAFEEMAGDLCGLEGTYVETYAKANNITFVPLKVNANVPAGSKITAGTLIELSSVIHGAKIYYTLDGSEPNEESMVYSSPIVYEENMVIRALLVSEDYISPIVEFSYIDSYKVSFESQGEITVETQMVEKGEKAVCPTEPIREGFQFLGWYLEEEQFDFDSVITKSMTLVAKWKELEPVDIPYSNILEGEKVIPGQEVVLKTLMPGAKIYYTLDGTMPTKNSNLYRGKLIISDEMAEAESVCICAVAMKEGYRKSEVAIFRYEISKAGQVLQEDIEKIGGEQNIPEGLWIAGVLEEGYSYTGKSIQPVIRVYHGNKMLTEKQDYTVAYKNNVKVNEDLGAKNAATITVTGKGNYSGKETIKFIILPKNISDADVTTTNLYLKYNGRVQKPVPVVTWNGKKLDSKKDYQVEYPSEDTLEKIAYKEAGEYRIVIRGKGNYSGAIEDVKLTITNQNLIGKASVSKIKNQVWNGTEIVPEFTVKYGKKVLKGKRVDAQTGEYLNAGEEVDFTYILKDNDKVGTAVIEITGQGEFAGKKEVTFKILGTSISKAKVAGIPKEVVYRSEPFAVDTFETQSEEFAVTVNNKILTKDIDYEITYQNNTEAGTATILITGKNNYNGSVKKTFKITSYDLEKDINEKMLVSLVDEPVYAKGGSKPKPIVMYGNTILTEGKDYTLIYKNNTSVNSGQNSAKVPSVIVRGKGNFKGNITCPFIITKQQLSNIEMILSDKVYQKRKNAYKVTPKIVDLDGKVLRAGTDYEKVIKYTWVLDDGVEVPIGAEDIPTAGAVIRVTVEGKGNYEGTLIGDYRIVSANIGKAKVTVQPQCYTGKQIVPKIEDIKIVVGKETLKAEDYEIVSCSNNVKKGTAQLSIRGKGKYGGTKTVKFQIKTKGF